MTYLRFGFHAGSGGNRTGIGDYFTRLDAAGLPAVLKSVDDYGPVRELLGLNGAPHAAVFRCSGIPHYDIPDYNLPAQRAANEHWARVRDRLFALAPDFDRQRAWLQLTNEPDKGRSEWLAEFSLHIANLALAEGYKVVLLGWAGGEPEPEQWTQPKMRALLEFASTRRDRVAIGLNEYSFNATQLVVDGWLIGRVEHLMESCANMGFAEPSVFIAEFGWAHNSLPAPAVAMQQLRDMAEVYTQYPSILGVFIWYLGGGYEGIADRAQPLIAPLRDWALEQDPVPPPPPPAQYKKVVHLLPQEVSRAEVDLVLDAGGVYVNRNTILRSHDDAGNLLTLPDTRPDSRLILWSPGRWNGDIVGHFQALSQQGRLFQIETRPLELDPLPGLRLRYPMDIPGVTVPGGEFNAPRDYANRLHEGLDFAPMAPTGGNVLAPATGTVEYVGFSETGYGHYVRLLCQHLDTPYKLYLAHMAAPPIVGVGQTVTRGQRLGLVGSSGNSSGRHIHLTVVAPEKGLRGYVVDWVVDPTDYMDLFKPPSTPPALIGLHASADPGDLKAAEIAEFAALKPGVIKVLSAHAGSSIANLAHAHPHAVFIVRAFLHFGGRRITPDQFVTDTFDDVARAVDRIGSQRVIWVEIHNEPNLAMEGWGTSWANGSEFATWARQVVALYRQALPSGVRYLYPGLSPGGDIPGVRAAAGPFLRAGRPLMSHFNGLAVHAYWSDTGGTMQEAVNHVLQATMDCGKPGIDTYITEASRNDRPATRPPTVYADEYLRFASEMGSIGVKGVTYFVATASDPYFAPETWVERSGQSKGIGAILGKRL